MSEERVDQTPEERLAELERVLKEEAPPTFVEGCEERWTFPHDPEQWVVVRPLTPIEIREYQAVIARTTTTLGGSDWRVEMRPAEGYIYLMVHGIKAYRFKAKDGSIIEGEQKVARDGRIINEKELRDVYGRLDGRIAAWLEQKLLIYNNLIAR
jgi:hypothetical protein